MNARIDRPVIERSFATHDGVDLFYRHWPAPSGTTRGAIVLLAPRARAFRPRRAPRRRAGAARLRLLRLGRARPRPLARAAGPLAVVRHVGARRADVRGPHRAGARHRAGRARRRRAERGRRARRHLGARLRAAHPRAGARFAGVQGQALRALRAARPCAAAEAAAGRAVLRAELRQGEVPHPRPGAHRVLRRRSADHARDQRGHPARALRRRRARGRRRAGDRRCPRSSSISGADWVVHHAPAARVLRSPRQRGQGEARAARASTTTRWASATARARWRRCARSCCASSTRRRRASTSRSAHRRAPRRTRRTRSRAPLPPLSPRGALLGRHAGEPALRRDALRGPRARPRDRLRLGQHARLRLPQQGVRRAGRSGRAIDRQYLDSIGWRGIRVRKTHVEELLREAMRRLRERGPAGARSSTSRPATDATCSTPATARRRARTPSCCATMRSSTCARAAR